VRVCMCDEETNIYNVCVCVCACNSGYVENTGREAVCVCAWKTNSVRECGR
jgi:hypothetical protein